MAGIEKICEISGEYGSYDMYRWKHNSIQIMPQYRKKFRNAKHTLYVSKGDLYALSKHGTMMGVLTKEQYVKQDYDRWFDSYQEYLDDCLRYGRTLVQETEYCLVVEDRTITGNVGGCYFNQSTEFSTVKRKLKRMLRCKELNIVFIEDNLYTYIRDNVREKY